MYAEDSSVMRSNLRLLGMLLASVERAGLPTLIVPGLLVVLPAGLMAAVSYFDGLYGQDAFAYYDYAVGPLRQSLLQATSPPPFFWPPGYPALVALVSLVIGPTPIAGQAASLAAGGLVPVFTTLLVREIWVFDAQARPGFVNHPTFVPVMAGLVTALNGQLWQSSVVVMSDTTALAWATLGAWALARYGRRGTVGWLILSTCALALAILTRWAYALVAIPCGLYALTILARRPIGSALIHCSSAALVAVIILWPVLNPAVSHALTAGGDEGSFVGDFAVYTWHPSNALRSEFVTADGLLRYSLPNGLYYAAAPAHRFYFTPLVAVLILPGLWALVKRRALAPVFLIIGWAAVIYGFHAGAPWQNFRFTLAYLPPLAALVSIGAAYTIELADKRLRLLIGFLLLVGLGWMSAGGVSLTQSFIERKHAHLAIVRWVGEQTPPDSRLLSFGLTLTFRHYSQIETIDLFEISPSALAAMLADGRPTFVLADVEGIESQWRGRSPSENYRALRDGPGLAAMGAHKPYELFRVGGNSP